MIYKQCYLPTVGYPLPATVIPPEKLNKNQRSTITTFIAKMGYPRSLPRAIAYAPKERGGIGLHLCGTDQGLHKVLQLLKHTRTQTSIGQVYHIVIQHYQLMSGLSRSVLQDTRPIPWSNALWIDTLRQFLHSIEGQINLRNPWVPIRRRINDRHIMDDILGLQLPRQQAIQLQSVRLFLHVSVLSEITDHTGLRLLPAAINRPNPCYHYERSNHNNSTLIWPHQPNPGPLVWHHWREMLSWLYLDQ